MFRCRLWATECAWPIGGSGKKFIFMLHAEGKTAAIGVVVE